VIPPAGRLPQQPGGGEDLEVGEPAGAAGLGREQLGDLVPAPLGDVGGAQEQRLLVRGRQLGPGREGRRRGVDRASRVRPGPGRDASHDGAPERVEIVEQLARPDPLAADVLLVLAHCAPGSPSSSVIIIWRRAAASYASPDPVVPL
jgi:hypothetical protein